MYIFVITADNKVTALAAIGYVDVPRSGHRFATLEELSRLTANWPGQRLVEIWNKLPNAKAVRRFTDRRTAVLRIWRTLQKLTPSRTGPTNPIARARGSRAKADPAEERKGTKTERIIALLKRPSGATLKDIMAETGWQPHSVRGFISAQRSKRMGFRIKSFKRGGERVYRVARNSSHRNEKENV